MTIRGGFVCIIKGINKVNVTTLIKWRHVLIPEKSSFHIYSALMLFIRGLAWSVISSSLDGSYYCMVLCRIRSIMPFPSVRLYVCLPVLLFVT